MFSLINLARHGGVSDLPTLAEVSEQMTDKDYEVQDTVELINSIGEDIAQVAEFEKSDAAEFETSLKNLFVSGVKRCLALAREAGFVPDTLLRENVRKYLVRCQAIETLAAEDGKKWADLAANKEIVAYWKRAKTLLK